VGAAAACVIAVRVGDHGARDRLPRIDVEVAGRAVQAFGTQHDGIGSGSHRVSCCGIDRGAPWPLLPRAATLRYRGAVTAPGCPILPAFLAAKPNVR
jgi:hypothetical protein